MAGVDDLANLTLGLLSGDPALPCDTLVLGLNPPLDAVESFVHGDLTGLFITKNVEFKDDLPVDLSNVDPANPADPLTALGIKKGLPIADLPNVGGVLGQIVAKVPFPVQVKVSFSWRVEMNGAPVAAGSWQPIGPLTDPQLRLVLPPIWYTLGTDAPTPTKLDVFCDVTAQVGSGAPTTVPVGPYSLPIPAVPVVTVALYGRHQNFAPTNSNGDAGFLIVHLQSSPTGDDGQRVDPLTFALNQLNNFAAVVGRLENVPGNIAGIVEMVTGVQALNAALSSGVEMRAVVGDVHALDDIDFEGPSDVNADNEISSMILVAAPVSLYYVQVYNDEDFSVDDEGYFAINTTNVNGIDVPITLIRDFNSVAVTIPAGCVALRPHDSGEVFNDQASSLKFPV